MKFKKPNKLQKQYSMGMSLTATPIDPYHFKCTKCGTYMQLKTHFDIYKEGDFQKKRFLECPKCGAYCEVKRSNSKNWYLKSTPADKDTRRLRQEAHYYFDLLATYKIFPDKSASYSWLTQKLGMPAISEDHIKHIGEFEKDQLEKTILESVRCLAANTDKVRRHLYIYDSREDDEYKTCSERNEEIGRLIEKINKDRPRKMYRSRVQIGRKVEFSSPMESSTTGKEVCERYLCAYVEDDICKNSYAEYFNDICPESGCPFYGSCVSCRLNEKCPDVRDNSLIDKTELKEDLDAKYERDNNNTNWLNEDDINREKGIVMQFADMMRKLAKGENTDD